MQEYSFVDYSPDDEAFINEFSINCRFEQIVRVVGAVICTTHDFKLKIRKILTMSRPSALPTHDSIEYPWRHEGLKRKK